MRSTPVPITATVVPPPFKAPRWAAASMPIASPLITITPAAARSADSCSATASPYGDGLREPTTATRSPAGGGQRPRERRPPTSGRCIVKPVAQSLEHVPVVDALCAVEVGGCARDAPRAMKAPRRQALLVRPPLERPARAGLQRSLRAQPRGLEHRVKTTLPLVLAPARSDDPISYGLGSFAHRFAREQRRRHAAHVHLQVDAIEQRA